MERFENIYNNETLNDVIEKEVINLLSRKIASLSFKENDKKKIRKAIWLASILSNSGDEKHLKKVQDLAILLFLNNNQNQEILKIVYILFSRIGNLAATKHLKAQEKFNFNEDLLLIQELVKKRIDNSILIEEKPYLLTDFQKELYENLHDKKHISISAPTSSGKSFILKKFIENEFKSNKSYTVFYIVPSRALINQVSEELRSEIPEIVIKNAFIEDEEVFAEKLIYVITPERALKIINSQTIKIIPNLIFVDEIQNVENEDGRGNLFEHVYEEFSRNYINTKIITAGPFISNSNKIFKELFNKESKTINTDLSPVFQLRTVIKLHSDSLSLTLFANDRVFYEIKDVVKIDKIERNFNLNIGSGLADIINVLSKKNESNLIYSPRGNNAQKWALKFSEKSKVTEDLPQELKDLINFIKTEIHPKYYLVKCLENRVAFHYSVLSEFVRKEIESLFESGIITTLFCTSTLLEGVNLPADNLFVTKPEKNNVPLSNFEFGNLIGRAGRLKNTLFGTIYCVSKKNNIEWVEDYYQTSYTKEVKTSSSKALSEIDVMDIEKPSTDLKKPKIKNLIISLRNKALRKGNELESFLNKYDIKNDKFNEIIKKVNNSINEIKIPYDIIKENPTIDPVLQDQVYKKVISDGLEKWVIHPNSNFLKIHRREQSDLLEYEKKNFFWQLDSIIVRLDEIFNITYEIWKKDSLSITPTGICINAVNWIEGNSIGELISSRIKYYSEDERVKPDKRIDPKNIEHINRMINDVIRINLKVTTFSFLKYLKVLVSILDKLLNEDQKEKYKMTLALPIHIELGTQEPVVILLISSGIPRTIALKIFNIFRKTNEFKNEISVLDWMKELEEIRKLAPIYNKFLVKNNFLKLKIKED